MSVSPTIDVARYEPIPTSPTAGEVQIAGLTPFFGAEAAGNLACDLRAINLLVSARTKGSARGNANLCKSLVEVVQVEFRDEVTEGGEPLALLRGDATSAPLGRLHRLTIRVQEHARTI